MGSESRLMSVSPDEEALYRAKRALTTIVECHEAIMEANSEKELLDKVCDILVKSVRYRLAWIGIAVDDAEKNVIPCARTGFKEGYLESLIIHWGEDKYSLGPTGLAIRTGKTQIVQDIHHNPEYEPWREKALEYGYQSSIALPCKIYDKFYYVLNIYASEPNAFDDKEVMLLEELSVDMAFGVRNIRTSIEKEAVQRELRSILFQTIGTIALILEKRDPYTTGHQERVAQLACSIAAELGWDEKRIEGLYFGALIHDIGKIYVPAEILSRPGTLTEAEMAIIRTHPQVGYDIVAHLDFPWPVKEVILQHHERLDGKGYPNGLKGGDIAIEAKIITVADVVEGISSHRPYRPKLGIEAALDEINKGRGVAFDGKIVDIVNLLFKEGRLGWKKDKPMNIDKKKAGPDFNERSDCPQVIKEVDKKL